MIAGGWVRSWAFRSSKGEGQCDLPANSIFGALDADNHVVRRPDGDADAEWRRMRAWQNSCRGAAAFSTDASLLGMKRPNSKLAGADTGSPAIVAKQFFTLFHTFSHASVWRRHKDNTDADGE